MASQLCLLPQMTRSKPGAPGSAVPQMPYVARPASLSSTPLSDPFRVASRPSDSTPIASQRYHDCPESDCCTVGLNQTVESMLSRRARSSPPTYDVNRRGQSVASWRRTRVESTASRWPSTTVSRVADVERPRGHRARAGDRLAAAGRRDRVVVREPVAGVRPGARRCLRGLAGRRRGRRGGRGRRRGRLVLGGVLTHQQHGQGAHGDQHADQERHTETPSGHWSVLAQQTDRRLPASHSASWNQV